MKQIAEETSFAYYECARVEAVLVDFQGDPSRPKWIILNKSSYS